LFVLFGGAAFWLAVSSAFGLIASLTFHKPAMFADSAMFSYGRASAVWATLLVYGFCIPAGLGVGMWLLARLGRVELAKPWLIAFGAKLWHLGVLVGGVAILAGENTGYEWLELPRSSAVILLLAFLLIAVWAFVTHTRRTEPELYPSQWFVLAALFWFPWIFTTATLLLQCFPVRGMVQASVAWWYAGNLLNVWLALAGLASTYYIVPKLTERPLQSRYLALFLFWTLILFGTWTGIPASAPLPAWMPNLSRSASLLLLVPALTIVAILILTTRGSSTPCGGGPLCYNKFGGFALALAMILLAAVSCPEASRITDFTWFGRGEKALRLYGFFMMTMFGAAYHILPRVAGLEMCRLGMRVNFWLGMLGSLLLSIPLLIGGVRQGLALNNPSVQFLDTAKAAVMYLRLATLGELLLLLASVLFLINVLVLVARYYRSVCKATCAELTALQPAEVKP
jgi:cytochrome c oxidase cbb3-type subunit 1